MDSNNETLLSAYRPDGHSTDFSRASEAELRRLKLLQRVDLDAVEDLLGGCLIRVLKSGEVLVKAGEMCPAIYFVLVGKLRVHDPSATVADSIVEAGNSVGELSLFQSLPSSTAVSALESTRVLAVDYHTIANLIAISSMAARNLLNVLAERLRSTPALPGGEQSMHESVLDEATGVHTRRWLETTLPRHITRSSQGLKPLSLLLVEIDGFARYHDDFGPEAQRQALYAVAQALLDSVRPTDMVARFDATRFAIVLPEADLKGAQVVAARLRDAVSETVIEMSDQSILPSVTISFGAAQHEPLVDSDGMIARAEVALRGQQGRGLE